MDGVYFDWNATTPPLKEVIEAMSAAARESWGNPSSVHGAGRTARACVENARQAVATLAGCDPRDVVFTSGGTEANNLALRAPFLRDTALEGAGAPVLVTSRLEHPSVARVAEALEREGRARVRWVRVLPDGVLDVDDLASALSESAVRLVAVQAVNSETGVIQPVAAVVAAARRAGARVHVDAVQAFGRIEDPSAVAGAGGACATAEGVGPDTRSLAAHKMRGPKSIGALVLRPGYLVGPVLLGGSQERGARPGTIDPVAAAGFAVAARHALTSPARWRELAPLRDELEEELTRLAPGARVNGAAAPRMPHVSSIAFPGWRGPELVAALDLEGLAVSAGSACSAGTAEPSSVLLAMGDAEAAASSVRFSLGEDTTPDDVAGALAAAARVFARTHG